MTHARDKNALECDQDDEPVAEYVVVEGAEELGSKERREASLAEQGKLVRSGQECQSLNRSAGTIPRMSRAACQNCELRPVRAFDFSAIIKPADD